MNVLTPWLDGDFLPDEKLDDRGHVVFRKGNMSWRFEENRARITFLKDNQEYFQYWAADAAVHAIGSDTVVQNRDGTREVEKEFVSKIQGFVRKKSFLNKVGGRIVSRLWEEHLQGCATEASDWLAEQIEVRDWCDGKNDCVLLNLAGAFPIGWASDRHFISFGLSAETFEAGGSLAVQNGLFRLILRGSGKEGDEKDFRLPVTEKLRAAYDGFLDSYHSGGQKLELPEGFVRSFGNPGIHGK